MQQNIHQFVDWLHRRGITDEVISLFNITVHTHPTIGECIRIPFSEHHAKYRRDPSDPTKPKYLYDAGGKVTLYGADKLFDNQPLENGPQPLFKQSVVITEGELDTLVLWSQNIPAVSSTGGAMSWQEEWSDSLNPYQVYLCFDNDDAGANGMIKVLKSLPNASVILIPEQPNVKDVSDYVARGGDFRSLMDTALHNLTPESVAADRDRRKSLWLSHRFHDLYLADVQKDLQKSTFTPNTYDGDDKVLRAKAYPIENLIDFRGRKACCPWHKEKTPSLQHYPKTNSAYCFGACGRAYDSIDAYKLKYGATFTQAVKELNNM